MKKKIVIIGALGYLGTELCKLYSGKSWYHRIIAIDNRFVSERVNQLKNWNIEFFQVQILDKSSLKVLLEDADVVHHLAGITNVAYVKKESNEELDDKIKKVAIEGTNNILEVIPNQCKIIFPSTHVIFEGFKNTKKNIDEEEIPCPILAYSSSKAQNEIDIKKSKKNYVILRLGSVYGYSNDSTRINIMPNLFSKISSLNGTINLFSGGRQIKSLVPLQDVVRCFKFMEENNKINKEIFHLAKENSSVKEVAEICKKINPKTKLKITKDEIPNLGYTLSNKKLLSTGFKFLYELETSIKEMITLWSSKNFNENLEYIKKGEKEFVDERGKISNYELPEAINLVGYIESKKGTIRANHYHPVQEQKCILIKGQYISIYKDLLNDRAKKVTHVVNEGDLIFTKPNVAHTMIFTKDSIFLNLVRGEREHENYGITHTIRHVLVNNEEKNILIDSYKFNCRCCGSQNLKRVLSLGYQPLANNLLKNKNSKCEFYPLEMNFCKKCYNCQLSVAVNPKKMFSNYFYLSSTSKLFREHFEKAAKKYINEFKLSPKKSYIIDVGSNDGIALKPFRNLKFKKLLGIEPAKNLAKIANREKIKTYNGFLDKNSLRKIKKNADLILASNVFAHSDDPKIMAECMFKLLKKNGIIVIEVQYLLNTLKDLTFDNIYHEHYNYWSLTTLVTFFNKVNGKIFRAEKINTHGGSLRIYVKKNNKVKIEKSVNDLLKEEKNFGIKDYKTYEEFSKKIYNIKDNVIKNISKIKENNNIVGYGSPAKATTALNFFGISNEIDFIVEDNKLKHGKYLPGVNIPIVGKDKISQKVDCILVLAWNFFEDIKKNNNNLCKKFINIKDLAKN
jgi:nucleoside-diphosphate-sugar epimerase/dTDP-4-dehydrorhamnose 3,5-epimerase-like enzyme/SAM-dependent methyltransferase